MSYILFLSFPSLFLKDIEELDLRAYINGGINITGYSIIDKETGLAEEFVEELRKQRVIKRDYKLSVNIE